MSKVTDIDERAWEANAAAFETTTLGLCQEARARLHADRPEEALTLLRRALCVDPESPRALSLYGYALAKARGDYPEALRICRLALRLAPGDPELRTNLGRVHRLRGNNGAAHRNFMEAFQHDRRHAGACAELTRMGIRRRPVLRFLGRGHWCNRVLGHLRHLIVRQLQLLRTLPRRLRTAAR